MKNLLKNINCFVDGRGHAGEIEELTPPSLRLLTEEFRGGGMDVAVDVPMGMEKLEASFSLKGYSPEVLKLFGLAPGNSIPLIFRGALEDDDGTVKAVVMTMRGFLREVDPGSWQPGQMAPLRGTVSLRYFKQTIDGELIHEIDADNMTRVINGVDQLAAQRQALAV